MYFHTDRHSHQSQTHYSDIIDVGAPWIPVVKVFRWRWFPSSAYQLPKTLWCLKKKKTQFFLTEKLIFTFLWQKPGEFTETLSPFWRQDTCSFFKKNVKDFRAVESFTQKIGSLLLTCLRSLAVLFRTRMLDMIFISTVHWKMRRLSWEKSITSVSVPWWNSANVLSLQNKKRQNKKVSFPEITFLSPINHPQSCHDRLHWLN